MKSGSERGFTYVAMLVAVAALGWGFAAIGETWSRTAQREKEAELLWIGGQFRQAIGLYYHRTPGAAKRYPDRLEDLLEDKRFLTPQRYLRQLYADPLTGKREWGLVRAPEGGIMGVHSLAAGPVLKRGQFGKANQKLEGSASYADWRFIYTPPPAASTSRPTPAR